jgi:hypothetical protein
LILLEVFVKILRFKENGTAPHSFVADALVKEEVDGVVDPETEHCIKCSAATLYAGKYLTFYPHHYNQSWRLSPFSAGFDSVSVTTIIAFSSSDTIT